MIRYCPVLLAVIALAACSSSDDDSGGGLGTVTPPMASGDTAMNGEEGLSEPDTGGGDDVDTDMGMGSGNAAGPVDPSIVGLWDVTDVDPEFGEDIFYLSIDGDGTVTDVDFQGDEFDGGGNCYRISVSGTLSPLGGNQYQFNAVVAEFDQTLTIARSGNSLNVSFVDETDDDNDGDTTEVLTDVYPMVTGVDPEFTECV